MLAAIERALALDEQLAPLEITAAQFAIVAVLGTGASKSASELCSEISYDAGAMTRMIDRLEDKGLVRRRRDPNDRRLMKLELAEQAVAAIPRIRGVAARAVSEFLRGFSPGEVGKLKELLARMLDNAQAQHLGPFRVNE